MNTIKHSVLTLAMGLVSSMFFGGCIGETSTGEETTAEAASMAGEQKKGDYGYEMKELRLIEGAAVPPGDAVTPDGRVAPEEVLRRATARIPALRSCYAKALQRDPGLGGTVVVRMHVEADGSVSSSRVSDGSIGDPALSSCLAKELGAMTFPAAEKGALEVLYPIELAPEDLAKNAPSGA